MENKLAIIGSVVCCLRSYPSDPGPWSDLNKYVTELLHMDLSHGLLKLDSYNIEERNLYNV